MAWEKDLLERKEVANFLHNLIESDDGIKVINIDSAWGTGKTFFLENWRGELKECRGVVYFNAWERDYTGDPFVSLVSAIKTQLEGQVGRKSRLKISFDDFSDKASNAIVSAAPIVIKEVVKGVVRKFTGVDVDKTGEAITSASGEDEGVVEVISDSARSVADKAAVQAVKSLIDNSEESIRSVDSFRVVFEELVDEVGKALSKGSDPGPVYVFVDELDRCRPTYAIELLERVKHFLDVPGCKFVIATDTKQLSHSVKAVYGSGFNSFGYLKRFFDITYSLDNSDLRGWVKSKVCFNSEVSLKCLKVSVKAVDKKSGYRFSGDPVPTVPDAWTILSEDVELDKFQIVIIALCKTFLVSLRDLDKIVIHMNAALSAFHKKEVDFIFLAYLVFLKYVSPDLYREFLDDEGESNRERLQEYYPPYKLYMVYECVGVHEVAAEYLRVARMRSEDVMREVNSMGESYSYSRDICLRAFEGEEYLEYVKPVELAGQVS